MRAKLNESGANAAKTSKLTCCSVSVFIEHLSGDDDDDHHEDAIDDVDNYYVGGGGDIIVSIW